MCVLLVVRVNIVTKDLSGKILRLTKINLPAALSVGIIRNSVRKEACSVRSREMLWHFNVSLRL